jgi:hypothetical protein
MKRAPRRVALRETPWLANLDLDLAFLARVGVLGTAESQRLAAIARECAPRGGLGRLRLHGRDPQELRLGRAGRAARRGRREPRRGRPDRVGRGQGIGALAR